MTTPSPTVDYQPPTPTAKPVQVKLVLLGEASVGKSSVVLRFVNADFQENKEPTIGAAFLTQKCRLDDRTIKFEIWDTAGQERFHSLAPMYYRNAQAAIVMYDITRASSLDKAKFWVRELQRQANTSMVIMLCGNKLDLANATAFSDDEEQQKERDIKDDKYDEEGEEPKPYRQVAYEEGNSYAVEQGLLFSETSAKTGENVNELFTDIAKNLPIEQLLMNARSHRSHSIAESTRVIQNPNAAQRNASKCAC